MPESAIANVFVFTADAYVAIFCMGIDGVFIIVLVASFLYSLFDVMSNSMSGVMSHTMSDAMFNGKLRNLIS